MRGEESVWTMEKKKGNFYSRHNVINNFSKLWRMKEKETRTKRERERKKEQTINSPMEVNWIVSNLIDKKTAKKDKWKKEVLKGIKSEALIRKSGSKDVDVTNLPLGGKRGPMCGNESGVLSRPGLARLNRNMRHITRQLLYRILAELNEIVHRSRSCVQSSIEFLEFSRRTSKRENRGKGKENRPRITDIIRNSNVIITLCIVRISYSSLFSIRS